jgi:hypothetical protein
VSCALDLIKPGEVATVNVARRLDDPDVQRDGRFWINSSPSISTCAGLCGASKLARARFASRHRGALKPFRRRRPSQFTYARSGALLAIRTGANLLP